MVRREVPVTPLAAIRCGLIVLLASISLPAVAASGFNLKCDDAPRPADLTASTAVTVDAAAGGDHEQLTVLKAEGDMRGLAQGSELGDIIESGFESDSSSLPTLDQQELRSSAIADALERRRRGRLEGPAEDIDGPATAPSVDTALPGIGDTESLLYRREMYRTDM